MRAFQLLGEGRVFDCAPVEFVPVTRIGSAADCDVRLDGLAERHARILLDRAGAVLDAAHPVRVNARPVSRARLSDGDELLLGDHRLIFHQPALACSTGYWSALFGCAPCLRVWAIGLAVAAGYGLYTLAGAIF